MTAKPLLPPRLCIMANVEADGADEKTVEELRRKAQEMQQCRRIICVVAASPCSIALHRFSSVVHVPVEVVHDMSGPTMIEHEDADERVAEEAIVALPSWPTPRSCAKRLRQKTGRRCARFEKFFAKRSTSQVNFLDLT